MDESRHKRPLQLPLTFFLTGILGTASTFIALEKYRAALYCVLVGGGCSVIVSIVAKIVDWLHPETD